MPVDHYNADDMTTILGSVYDIDITRNIIQMFGRVSGLKLNLSKTVGIPLGQDATRIHTLTTRIKWTNDPVKILGIYVGGMDEDCERLNWESRISSLEKTLHTWKQRNLTLFGKVIVVKVLALPQLVYTASNTTVPDNILHQIERLIFNFIWKPTEPIKRNQIINPIEEGGLNIIDIPSHFEALKAVWISRIMQDAAGDSWAMLPKYYLRNIGTALVTQLNFTSEVLLNIQQIPHFYGEAVKAYSKAKPRNEIKSKSELLQQVLWGNHLFTITHGKTKEVLFFKNWIREGIIKLYQ